MSGGIVILLIIVAAAIVFGVGIMLYVAGQAGRKHDPEGDLNDDAGRSDRPEHVAVENEGAERISAPRT